MTLKKLMQEIEVQGDVRLRVYNENMEKYILDEPITGQIKTKYANHKVSYLYPGNNEFFIEIVEE